MLEDEQPGAFKIEVFGDAGLAWFTYNCPCGCGSVGQFPLVPKGVAHDNHTWEWDGNSTHPTLIPSIRRHVECKFHGHMQSGVWSACSDGAQLSPNVYRAP